ncbi:MAG: ABC transporter ATP-binding protein [Halobacteriales archaeon]
METVGDGAGTTLRAEAVTKTYDGTVALDGVSMSVASGEVFALIGPNGAGKTTFVRCVTGTAVPDSGAVEVLDATPTAVDKQRIGLLPQSFDPPSRLTPRELVEYYGGLFEESRSPTDALTEVGLEDARKTRYEDLSGGQQRRTCVAIALVNDPELLFLDEPTTGIDPAGRQALWSVIEDLAAAGTTVLLTTHNMAEAEHLADRVGLLADGNLVAVDTPTELIETHGGDSRLRVETDADPAAFESTPYAPRTVDGELVFVGITATDIGDIVRLLDDQEIPFEGLHWTEPDLEDVYLELTGKQIGAEGETAAVTQRGSKSR